MFINKVQNKYMPTKATVKLVKQLKQKKYRKTYQMFIVEGKKSVEEFLQSDFELVYFFVHSKFREIFPQAEVCSSSDLKQMSNLQTPPEILAVFKQKDFNLPLNFGVPIFALDNIQDPGNLGTIIRLADWFGMQHIICNKDSVDVYNPKVIQACMGSLTRVQVHYVDLKNYLNTIKTKVYGTFMDGKSIYKTNFESQGIIVLGNESNGISNEIEDLCDEKISIPQAAESSTESLNVAIASAIISGEIFRQTDS